MNDVKALLGERRDSVGHHARENQCSQHHGREEDRSLSRPRLPAPYAAAERHQQSEPERVGACQEQKAPEQNRCPRPRTSIWT
jgi:hypothetical protein